MNRYLSLLVGLFFSLNAFADDATRTLPPEAQRHESPRVSEIAVTLHRTGESTKLMGDSADRISPRFLHGHRGSHVSNTPGPA
jgi:hypothetical protein